MPSSVNTPDFSLPEAEAADRIAVLRSSHHLQRLAQVKCRLECWILLHQVQSFSEPGAVPSRRIVAAVTGLSALCPSHQV